MSFNVASCAAVSMPSAMTFLPSERPRLSTARTISTFCGWASMLITNERSIFRLLIGTGYSSLAYLSTLPLNSLKIDRSFVMSMDAQPQNVEIVRAVLTLGRSLGKKVIAEGIETAAQLATLKEIGVLS